ncbi:MAG: undecaprenyldiphospho-muramoylpentapeptide beta-N-acetylglucosaminyltransferase [Candidatus Cloacimonetes bacterium]|nr:undecaprenyldiphospho-muramoylpentapeptide beta-N-acetylglucosaminyltransferase [Candidatus Cloacimonadota bacterium]
MLRIIVTAGGTGGHIFPAIAIIEELQARGIDILFVGNQNSMEEKIVKDIGIPFRAIDVQKLYRSFTLKHLKFPYKFLKSYILSNKILDEYKPDCSIGTGGFVSAPILICAATKGIPIFLQEQNSYPGLTTRLLRKRAEKIFIAYESAMNYLPNSSCEYTGNPLQKGFTMTREADVHHNTSPDTSVSLLILGGSQGAQAINDTIIETIPDFLKLNMHIIWQTGERNYERVKEMLGNLNSDERIEIFPFSFNMQEVYRRSDIAVSRAGALTLAELEHMRIPAIVIPLPHSAGNHQYHNARQLEEQKKVIMIKQAELTSAKFLQSINIIRSKLDEFRSNMIGSKHATAAAKIADIITTSIKNKAQEGQNVREN